MRELKVTIGTLIQIIIKISALMIEIPSWWFCSFFFSFIWHLLIQQVHIISETMILHRMANDYRLQSNAFPLGHLRIGDIGTNQWPNTSRPKTNIAARTMHSKYIDLF